MIGWKVIPRIGIGPLQFSPHGVGIAFGCFVGAWLMARRARAKGFDENHAWNTAAWGVVGAIIGARAAYVIGHLDAFSSPVQWLEIWKGGISLIGGLLGGVALAALYFRRHGLDFWEFADLGAPGLALGIALGRSGDLVIGDDLGLHRARDPGPPDRALRRHLVSVHLRHPPADRAAAPPPWPPVPLVGGPVHGGPHRHGLPAGGQ